MRTAVVDLFCGIGGLTCGLKKAGLNVTAGVDFDKTCQYAYEENNNAKFIHEDISKLPASEVDALFKNADIKILVGCAPCQTFSTQANKYHKLKDLKADPRWVLLDSFSDYIEKIMPDVVSMENVPSLMKQDVFQRFVSKLEKLGYSVKPNIVNCAKYGLPQKRRRLVLLASLHGEIDLIKSDSEWVKKKRTVRDVLGNLPKLKHGERDKNDPLHRCAGLTPINIARVKQSIPGGTWRDWDEKLLPECYRRESGQTFSSVYGRMEWDKPSPTITTQFFSIGTGRYGHPEQNRAISLREGALLQTFPETYKFFADVENLSLSTISRHIGNAVPVDLGWIIGLSINEHLKNIKNNKTNKNKKFKFN